MVWTRLISGACASRNVLQSAAELGGRWPGCSMVQACKMGAPLWRSLQSSWPHMQYRGLKTQPGHERELNRRIHKQNLIERKIDKLKHQAIEDLRRVDKKNHKINDEIPENKDVLFIIEKENLGVMKALEAREMCRERGLDLVMINESIQPPICKGINYREYLQNLAISNFNHKLDKKKAVVRNKELRLSATTSGADYDRIMKHGQEFLQRGWRLRIFIKFKAGQQHMQKEAIEQLDKAVQYMVGYGDPIDFEYRKIERDANGKIIYKPLKVDFVSNFKPE